MKKSIFNLEMKLLLWFLKVLKLGIDVENLEGDVNIVIQVEGEGSDDDELFLEDDEMEEPNEWRFDDDPYDVVYYEFVNDED